MTSFMAWPATTNLLAVRDTAQADITIKATGIQWKWGYDYIKGEGEGINFVANLTTPQDQIYGKAPRDFLVCMRTGARIEFTSPEMFAELKLEIEGRQGAANQTDVVTLEAELLGVDTGPVEQLASVRFTGMIREEVGASAQPFDEVWNFARPVDTQGGWVLAGIQQLTQA